MSSRRVLCVWLSFFLFVLALSVFTYWGAGTFRLAREHAQTRGVILGDSPFGHAGVIYRFEAGGRTYAADRSIEGHPRSPGTPVTVFYLPADPSITLLDDPWTHLLQSLAAAVFLGALLASAVAALLVHATRLAADYNARMAEQQQNRR